MLRATFALVAAALLSSAWAAAPTVSLVGSPNQEAVEGAALSLDVTTLVASLTDDVTSTNDITVTAASTGTPSLSFTGCNGGAYGSGCTITGSGSGNVVTPGNTGTFTITLTFTDGDSEQSTATFDIVVITGLGVAFSGTDSAAGTSTLTVTFTSAVPSGFDNSDLTIAGATCTAVSSADSGVTYTSTCTADGSAGTVSVTVVKDAGTGFAGSSAVTYTYSPTLLTVKVLKQGTATQIGSSNAAVYVNAASVDIEYTFSGKMINLADGDLSGATATVASGGVAATSFKYTVTSLSADATATLATTAGDVDFTPTSGNNAQVIYFDNTDPTVTPASSPQATGIAGQAFSFSPEIGTHATVADASAPAGSALSYSLAAASASGLSVSAGCASFTAATSATCTVTGTTSGSIPAATAGDQTFTLTATDTAGNSGTGTITITVYKGGSAAFSSTSATAGTGTLTVTFTSAVSSGFDNSDLTIAGATCDTASSSDSGVTYTATCTADGSTGTVSVTVGDDTASGFKATGSAATFSYAPELSSIDLLLASDDSTINNGITQAAGIKVVYTFTGKVASFTTGSLTSTQADKAGGSVSAAPTVSDASASNNVWTFTAALDSDAVTTTFVLTLSDGGVTPTLGSGVSNSVSIVFDEAVPVINLGTGPFYLEEGQVVSYTPIGAGKVITSISDDASPDNAASLKVKIAISDGVNGRLVSSCSGSLTAGGATSCTIAGSGTGGLILDDSHGKYTLTVDAQDASGRDAVQATATLYVRATITNGAGVGKATKVLNAPFSYPQAGFTRTVTETFDDVCASTGGAGDVAVDVAIADTAGSQATNCNINNDGNTQGDSDKPGLTCVFDAAGTISVTITCTHQFTDGDSDAVDTQNVISGSWAITENTPPTVSASGGFTYTENGVARRLSDDVTFSITDSTDTQLRSVKIQRTNCPSGNVDVLAVGAGLPASVTATVSVDQCTVDLAAASGASDIADFITALNLVTFRHKTDNPTTKDVTMELTAVDNAGGLTPPGPFYYLNKTAAFSFRIIEVNDNIGYAMMYQNSNFSVYSSMATTGVRITENPADGACLKDSRGTDVELIIEDVDALNNVTAGAQESHIKLEIMPDAAFPSNAFWTLVRTAGPSTSQTSLTNSTLVPGNEEFFVYEKFKVCVAAKGATTSEGAVRPTHTSIDFENKPPYTWPGMTLAQKMKLRFRATSPAGNGARLFDVWYQVEDVDVERPQWFHPVDGVVDKGRRNPITSTGLANPRKFYRSALKPDFTFRTDNLDSTTGNVNADTVKLDFYPEADISFNVTYPPIDFVHGKPNAIGFSHQSILFLETNATPVYTLYVKGEVLKTQDGTDTLVPSTVTEETLTSGQMTTMGGVFSSALDSHKFKFEANATHIAFFGFPAYGPNNGVPRLQNVSSGRASPSARRFKFELKAANPANTALSATRTFFIDVEVRGCMDVRGSFTPENSTYLTADLTTLPTAANKAQYDTANWVNVNGNFNENATIPALCAFPPKAVPKGVAGTLAVPGARSETSAAALVAALGASPSADDLESARGFVGVDVPAGATTREVPLEVSGVTEDIALAIPPPPKDGAVVDTDLTVKLGPCGEQFDQPVEVCVFVGATDPTSAFVTMYHASAVSCTDPTLGYADFQPTTGNTYDPTTGKVCGKVSSFSIVSAVSVPVPAASQLEARFFNMGGGCPSDCSGHGYCRAYGKCLCFQGFTGFDCSQRSCPYGEAWAADSEVTRQSAECSGRGQCDRSSGECQCYDGFEGPRCERMTCENDCSGHGKCRYISEQQASSSWSEWDASRIQSCDCDPGYFGSDCSMRYCPFGDDPQTHCSADASSKQSVTVSVPGTPAQAGSTNYPAAPATLGVAPNQAWTVKGASIVVDFTDAMSNTYTTPPVHNVFAASGALSTSALGTAMLDSVKSLPNYIVDSGITITSSSASSNVADRTVVFEMTGDSNGGDAVSVRCPTQYGCPFYGCRPRWEQPHLFAMQRASTDVLIADPVHVVPPSSADGVAIKITVASTGGVSTFAAQSCPITVASGVPTEGACSTVFSARPVPNTARNAAKPTEIAAGVSIKFASTTPTVGSYNFYYIVGSCSTSVVRKSGAAREGIECAGRGVCDRTSGLCDCFDGYQGFNCASRTITI